MLIHIPGVLDADQLREFRRQLDSADWADGRGSAGYLAAQVKRNRQLPDTHPLARQLGESILRALHGNALFVAAALPHKILPPLFNSYEGDESYGRHVDGAIRPVAGTSQRIRTDLSATLFLSDPDSYDGGELCIEDSFGPRSVKLPAGDLVLYPGTSVHSISAVTRGRRLASFFWIQSMVREDAQRALLFTLDKAVQQVAALPGGSNPATELASVYHNLLRHWADV
ncbi:MAG: Fe2+-dependent dioxygenase [Pseudohongiellaceae bacterium]|jgi:PKHD-type hydroxylase